MILVDMISHVFLVQHFDGDLTQRDLLGCIDPRRFQSSLQCIFADFERKNITAHHDKVYHLFVSVIAKWHIIPRFCRIINLGNHGVHFVCVFVC
ncbi:hypothetical protein NY2A_b234R [Paramecium bursaria Chlorella virus NY2A]|uniref:Uncharacterized protein b234R n=1 Tax=Paramecium bursaria Chlorella virus NY2A TaxID=46021 RepID=A7IWA9_PBCVN|nr:hypothetical protein NY2A_b234R [Paramecium bursaria Chlorella virus NY2A]YP_001498297.1 hypothetical protein AR158_c215R [Paramecium bursaria Chlorella virus AR158]ABT14633.1 hypothetical protein NY2A_b234R [Paramecium bursaria Chlorella virus NY2A]ABU43761.1 hypothetical protein AR158_c215R [Paramecium bursaria Chlorella virus AR158]